MTKRATVLICGLWLAAVAVPAAPPQEIVVVGQADRMVDRQNVQDAIDAASPGSTITLVGTFLLDGERIFITRWPLTLTGEPLDDDADGRANEDWVDGVDNDADGLMDEDDWNTVLVGLADPDGRPVSDVFLDYYYNRAISLEGVTGTASGVTIRHIRFSTFDRGINLFPEYFWGTKKCADLVPTGGVAKNIVIENNRFDNNWRDVVPNGEVLAMTVRNNRSTGALSGSVLLLGVEFGCIRPDGFDDPVPMGIPTKNVFTDNYIAPDPNAWGILSLLTNGTTATGNTVEGGFVGVYSASDEAPGVSGNRVVDSLYGIAVEGSAKAGVSGNEVTGALIGLYGAFPSPLSRFSNNRVEGAFYGGLFEVAASGFTTVNDDYEGSVVVDVLLDDTTFENTVIATDFVTTVFDAGVDNKLIGTLAMTENPGVPDDVRQRLRELREKLASLRP